MQLDSVEVYQLGEGVLATCLEFSNIAILEAVSATNGDVALLCVREALGLDLGWAEELLEMRVIGPSKREGKPTWPVAVQTKDGSDVRRVLIAALPGQAIRPEDRDRLTRRATDGSSDESGDDGSSDDDPDVWPPPLVPS